MEDHLTKKLYTPQTTDLLTLSFQAHQVNHVFRSVNQRKVPKSDVPSKVLKVQLSVVFTKLSNVCLTSSAVPPYL